MFRDNNGLITKNEDGVTGENSFLWTVLLFVVLMKKGENTESLEFTLNNAILKMNLGNGLYKQAPDLNPDSNNKDTYMSHDQLTALICYFSLTGREDKIKEIQKAFRFGFSYNNVDSKLRPYHPRDLIFYSIMSGGILGWLFLPLLWVITAFTFHKEVKVRNEVDIIKTDGELLYYMKRECTKCFKPINPYCEKRIRERFGSWDNTFGTYFANESHIINQTKNK